MKSHLRLASLAVLLGCLMLRAIVSYDPFPGWADDPTRLPAALTAMGPAGSSLVDAVMLLASAAVVALAARPRCPGDFVWWVLALIATVSGLVLSRTHTGDVDNLALGLDWSAAMFGGLAIFVSARDATCRRVSAAVLLGLVGLLVSRAGVQYLVENPQAYQDFLRSKQVVLAAHGWGLDSPLTRSFERRVSQADAGGWFGLSNVLGSVAAGCSVAFLCLSIRTWRSLHHSGESRRDAGLWLLLLGVAASSTTLAFSMSKGAMVAAGGGMALLALSHLKLRPVAGRVLGLACIAGPLGLVVIRGLIGTRLHELSLLFRWFYMQGAARIIAGPGGWTGVGPGGFQDQYMLFKPAISPENVSSPHSILLDCLAAFGIFGLAWGAVIVLGAMSAGTGLVPIEPSTRAGNAPARGSMRGELRLVVAIAAIPTVLAAFVELEIASEWSTAVRLFGLVAYALAAAGVLLALRRDPVGARVAIAVGALTVLAHAQIDMVGTTPGSSAWFFGLLALAAAPGAVREEDSGPDKPARADASDFLRFVPPLSAIAVVASLAWCATPLRRLWLWERELRDAAVMVRPIPFANMLATRTNLGTEHERLVEAADILAKALDRKVGPSLAEVAAGAQLARVTLVDRAIPKLIAACDLMPGHFGTHQATSEQMLTQGLLKRSLGDEDAGVALLGRSGSVMEEFVQRRPEKATAWAWLGLVSRRLAETGRFPISGATALDAYLQAVEGDPHGVVNIPPLVELEREHGRVDQARKWANEGLARNALLHLDPMAQLTAEQVSRLRDVVGGP